MAQSFTTPQAAMHDAPAMAGDRNSLDGEQQLAWLTESAKAVKSPPYHYLLIFRFALVNLLALSLLVVAYLHGLVDQALAADRTYLTHIIGLVFLCGFGACALRIWQTSQDLNQAKSFNPLVPSRSTAYIAKLRGRDGNSRAILASTLRLNLSQRIAVVRNVAGSLVILGLIGTVLGFIIALSGVDPEKASDVQAITPMISTLIAGMSTALYTTLVGAILNVWLMCNYQVLAGGTVKLISALVELGEEHGSA